MNKNKRKKKEKKRMRRSTKTVYTLESIDMFYVLHRRF